MPLRTDALRIWQAGVEAVRAERLMEQVVRVNGASLEIAGETIPLENVGRLAVVGAGKAGAGMAVGLECALGDVLPPDRRTGWVNVPADCLHPTRWIHLHAGRPAGVNAPTAEGVAGTRQIVHLVESLQADDLCIVLLSGGGSALLTAPAAGITLEDKQTVTRLLSERGACIEDLNCVRRELSEVKGGGLLRHCRAGTFIVLIISDVIGDPLETIASGPTVPNPTTAADALAVLRRYVPDRTALPASIWSLLASRQASAVDQGRRGREPGPAAEAERPRIVRHHVIANNRTACEAAARQARDLGYQVPVVRPDEGGIAREVGAALADECRQWRDSPAFPLPLCLITGGEPVVHLAETDQPRRGGRNQELVLAAVERLWDDGAHGISILSGGTDGEDGPTDAAGAVLDAALLRLAREHGLHPAEFLARHDSYTFFAAVGGLIKTGATHTNVMDVRVALVAPQDGTG
jgi:glycerate 2-kinase